jgi:hypothetical protein
MLLTNLAIASFLFCICFTYYTAKYTETHQGQSVKESMQEAWMNIAIGFSINYVANFFILPLAVTGLDPVNNFMIGWLYTTLSFIRQFVIRRLYNARGRHEKS